MILILYRLTLFLLLWLIHIALPVYLVAVHPNYCTYRVQIEYYRYSVSLSLIIDLGKIIENMFGNLLDQIIYTSIFQILENDVKKHIYQVVLK